jgi:membrane-associated phospholipid phosphatase
MRRQTALWTVVTLFVGAAVLLGVMVALGALDVHVLTHSRIGSEDRTIENNFVHHRDAFWNSVTKVLTYGAETLPVIVASVVLCVIAAVVFRRWHEPVFVASTLIGEVTVFVLTTLLIHRARPTVPQLDHAPPTSSFPSGHTAAATCLYGAIAVLVVAYGARRGWRILAIAIAVLVPVAVALSRIYRGMHYPTDVLGGLILGVSWLFFTSRVLLTTLVKGVTTSAAASGSSGHVRAPVSRRSRLTVAHTSASTVAPPQH